MKKVPAILFCLALAGALIWQFWPGYGSGYSEEQRQLWNKRKGLYPVSWAFDIIRSLDVSVTDRSEVISLLIGEDVKETEILLKKQQESEKEIDERLKRNRDRSAPEFPIKVPVPVDVSSLPLEGLTKQEVAERALAGDGDACLKMVQYFCPGCLKGVASLTWREKRTADKWLDRAIALKRPGAGFIKNFLEEARIGQIAGYSPSGSMRLDSDPDMAGVAGYAEFAENLKKGDYLLYETAIRMRYSFDSLKEYVLIRDGILDRTRQGASGSLADMAKLYFYSPEYRLTYYRYNKLVDDVLGEEQKWEKRLAWLPGSWRKGCMRGAFSCGVIGMGSSLTISEYKDACLWARKAARQGDLTGMYLWLVCGLAAMDRYSAEDWNDILKYSRCLLETGYAPYIERMQKEHMGLTEENKTWNDLILRSFYSRKSYEDFWKKDYMTVRGGKNRRSYIFFFGEEIIDRSDLEKNRKIVGDLCLMGQTDRLLRNLNGSGACELFSKCSREVQGFMLQLLEQWSEEGDPMAMYVLAGIHEIGISVPVDAGKAYALLKRALPVAEKYPRMTAVMKNTGDRFEQVNVYLASAIRIRMADMVWRLPAFPGRDEKEAYDGALRASRDLCVDHFYPAEVYHILGRFHELGLGMPVNREQALEYYKRGAATNEACREGVGRISPEGKDVKPSSEK